MSHVLLLCISFYAYWLYLFTCDMYMCRLRLIIDSVLSSLKMEGTRLLYYLSSPTPSATPAHTYDYVTRFKVNIVLSSGPSSDGTTPKVIRSITPPKTYKCQNTETEGSMYGEGLMMMSA
jgi:hypothetical protein